MPTWAVTSMLKGLDALGLALQFFYFSYLKLPQWWSNSSKRFLRPLEHKFPQAVSVPLGVTDVSEDDEHLKGPLSTGSPPDM